MRKSKVIKTLICFILIISIAVIAPSSSYFGAKEVYANPAFLLGYELIAQVLLMLGVTVSASAVNENFANRQGQLWSLTKSIGDMQIADTSMLAMNLFKTFSLAGGLTLRQAIEEYVSDMATVEEFPVTYENSVGETVNTNGSAISFENIAERDALWDDLLSRIDDMNILFDQGTFDEAKEAYDTNFENLVYNSNNKFAYLNSNDLFAVWQGTGISSLNIVEDQIFKETNEIVDVLKFGPIQQYASRGAEAGFYVRFPDNSLSNIITFYSDSTRTTDDNVFVELRWTKYYNDASVESGRVSGVCTSKALKEETRTGVEFLASGIENTIYLISFYLYQKGYFDPDYVTVYDLELPEGTAISNDRTNLMPDTTIEDNAQKPTQEGVKDAPVSSSGNPTIAIGNPGDIDGMAKQDIPVETITTMGGAITLDTHYSDHVDNSTSEPGDTPGDTPEDYTGILGGISSLLQSIWDAIAGGFTSIIEAIQAGIDALVQAVNGLVEPDLNDKGDEYRWSDMFYGIWSVLIACIRLIIRGGAYLVWIFDVPPDSSMLDQNTIDGLAFFKNQTIPVINITFWNMFSFAFSLIIAIAVLKKAHKFV